MIYTIKLTTELIVEQIAANEAEAIAQALEQVPQWMEWRAEAVEQQVPTDTGYSERLPGMLEDEWDDLE